MDREYPHTTMHPNISTNSKTPFMEIFTNFFDKIRKFIENIGGRSGSQPARRPPSSTLVLLHL